MTAEQARKTGQQVIDLVALANRPSNPTRFAPPVGACHENNYALAGILRGARFRSSP